ncbi:MAG TPA: hypothetical protein VNQ33_05105, partial [Acidimicrobiales bacterium]|nr:hypothetical protein [Acidimicrobiales bacterium]
MSQFDSQTSTIDGHSYTVRMLPARRATRMLAKLSSMIGPALGTLAEGGKLSDLADAKVNGKLFSRAAVALFAHVDEDAVDAILMELADVTTVEPGGLLKPIYDVHFMGRQGALMKWAAFALRVQYADFFDVAS